MEASQAWQATKGQLQMELPKATYDTWVRDTKFVDHQENTFVIGVQTHMRVIGLKTG
jgi:chromosomal replication initiator protein